MRGLGAAGGSSVGFQKPVMSLCSPRMKFPAPDGWFVSVGGCLWLGALCYQFTEGIRPLGGMSREADSAHKPGFGTCDLQPEVNCVHVKAATAEQDWNCWLQHGEMTSVWQESAETSTVNRC